MTRCVALYCRLSPRPDGRYEGVDAQERWGREYAARTWPGMRVEVFADAGVSAARDDVVRPEFERLKMWIADGKIAHVWAVEQSRIERSIRWFQYVEMCEEAGITELHTNRDGLVQLDSDMADYGAVRNRREVKRMRARVLDTLAEKARQGEPSGARPYGYVRGRKDDEKRTKTYLVVPEQAEVIREAADKVLAGWSLGAIAAELAGRGLRAPHGGRMIPEAVRRFLVTPAVAGKRVHGERVYPGNWTPILDEQTWEAVCARLAAPRTVTRSDGRTFVVTEKIANRTRPGRKYLLTGGLIRCGVCEAPLVGSLKQERKRNGTYVRSNAYYLCHPTRGGGKGCVGALLEPVEKHVADELFRELDRPEFLAAITSDEHAARRDELTQELEAVERRRDRLGDRWADGEITEREWDRQRDRLAATVERLRVELAAVAPPTELPDIAAVREAWDDPDALTLDERREFLRLFIRKVTLYRAKPGARAFDPARVEIEYR